MTKYDSGIKNQMRSLKRNEMNESNLHKSRLKTSARIKLNTGSKFNESCKIFSSTQSYLLPTSSFLVPVV